MLTRFPAFFVLSSLISVSVVACSASDEDAGVPDPATATAGEELSQSFTACQADEDCVAVSRGGCCPAGILSAVNAQEVQAFREATKCTANPHPACPSIFVHDTRVALCDSAAKRCKMVVPESIPCGGLVADAHRCPAGFECSFVGSQPDFPGKCVSL
jgi:hypothetical protein